MFKQVAVVIWGALCIAPLYADQWTKRTVVTFGEAVEIPGMVLPAGEYVFKLADSMSNRNIVQVFNAEENEIHATILAIPHYRLRPNGDTVILFEERSVGTPRAIHAWFYPGDNYGQEFVYPGERARELARETKEPVLSANITPTETIEQLEEAQVIEITPEEEEAEVAEALELNPPVLEPPATAAAGALPQPELPKTASPLPLIGLLGTSALGLAWLIKVIRTRIS